MPSSGMIEHELENVTKVYQQGKRTVEAVRGVSLQIASGEFVSIMGPSGSGKSTLLHLLGALDTPTSGRVIFHGRDLQAMSDRERSLLRRTQLGFVFQFFNLLPTLTAVENVTLPLLLAGESRRRSRMRALAGLERVGLLDRADHFPDEMSGGEMQRVAIARALITEPQVVICDEPTGNLDSATGQEILALLSSLPEEGKRSVVMVTHDVHAARFGHRLIHFRDGLIERIETISRSARNAYENVAEPHEDDGIGRNGAEMPCTDSAEAKSEC
ncbi:MAG: peptide ABC transporter ATP-binding protein [Gemmatales bacterium]|nr:MAG: peptide ABC transporter ATP-binding protein [Gemmatales bacterium]